MSQNSQTHFKNLSANAASVSGHFGTLCIKGLSNIWGSIYDFSCLLFSQKSLIADVWPGSKYTSTHD